MTSYLVSTFHPLTLLFAVPFAVFVGYLLGLYGLTRAEDRAFARLVAAQQRKRQAMQECRQ